MACIFRGLCSHNGEETHISGVRRLWNPLKRVNCPEGNQGWINIVVSPRERHPPDPSTGHVSFQLFQDEFEEGYEKVHD